ncbi:hypothetical protein LCGC14_3148840, partial [marine sediment metagenome]
MKTLTVTQTQINRGGAVSGPRSV